MLVGVAAAIKLTPLLFVVFFLVAAPVPRRRAGPRRRSSPAPVLAALVLPDDSWTYWTGTILQTSRIGDLASLGNQSVHGMLLRAGLPPGRCRSCGRR